MKIALISCASQKQEHPCCAKEMYMPSRMFSMTYQYAKNNLKVDKIFILSAKYGLLNEEDIIEPYVAFLNDLPIEERRVWSNHVVEELKKRCDIENDEFYVLAGNAYHEYVSPELAHCVFPMEHKRYNDRLIFLEKELKESAGDRSRSISQIEGNFIPEEVLEHVREKLDKCRYIGVHSVTLDSEEIHKELRLKDEKDMVCNAMKEAMGSNDKIISQNPEGPAIVIEYNVKRMDL